MMDTALPKLNYIHVLVKISDCVISNKKPGFHFGIPYKSTIGHIASMWNNMLAKIDDINEMNIVIYYCELSLLI